MTSASWPQLKGGVGGIHGSYVYLPVSTLMTIEQKKEKDKMVTVTETFLSLDDFLSIDYVTGTDLSTSLY